MGETAAKLNALVLDANPRWCNVVVGVLARLEIATVGTVATCAPSLTLVQELSPDLFVADVRLALEDVGGLPCLTRALLLHPNMRAIALSDEDDPVTIVHAFRAGAHAYVLKSAEPEELAAAVRQVFNRSVFFPTTRVGLAEAAGARARARRLLTRRELQILEFAAAGVPNAEIARELWLSEQTIKFHLSNLYKKIGVSNRTGASRWAYQHGVLGVARARPPVMRSAG
jgi:DNA-binding NarL/FixJ family response regulator